MEQMVVNLNKHKKSKKFTHKITMGWTMMIIKHSTVYMGFDNLCSNKSSHLYYSEKSVFQSYSSKILNTKYIDAMEQVSPHLSRVKARFTPNWTSAIPLQHPRVKIRLVTHYSASLGTSMRLKVECTEVIHFKNPTLWWDSSLIIKRNTFHMLCVQ